MIVANCITLATMDPCETTYDSSSLFDCPTPMCFWLRSIDAIVLAFFTVEMLLKMMALSVVGHRNAYLADAWNRLDALIVLLGAAEYFFSTDMSSNLTIIRLVRVLRPLRAIRRIPNLRLLVTLLFDTLTALSNVCIIFVFVYLVFGITGLQLWAGVLRHRCYLENETIANYPIANSSSFYFSSSSMASFSSFIRNNEQYLPTASSSSSLNRKKKRSEHSDPNLIVAGSSGSGAGSADREEKVSGIDALYQGSEASLLASAEDFLEVDATQQQLLSGLNTSDSSSAAGEEFVISEELKLAYTYKMMPSFYMSQSHPDIVCGGFFQCGADVEEFEKHESLCSAIFPDGNEYCTRFVPMYAECRSNGGPNPSGVSFDNIGAAWITIFQAVSLEGWTEIMYLLQDAHSFWVWPYFIFLVIFGSFAATNLCFVVIATQIPQTKRRLAQAIRNEKLGLSPPGKLFRTTSSKKRSRTKAAGYTRRFSHFPTMRAQWSKHFHNIAPTGDIGVYTQVVDYVTDMLAFCVFSIRERFSNHQQTRHLRQKAAQAIQRQQQEQQQQQQQPSGDDDDDQNNNQNQGGIVVLEVLEVPSASVRSSSSRSGRYRRNIKRNNSNNSELICRISPSSALSSPHPTHRRPNPTAVDDDDDGGEEVDKAEMKLIESQEKVAPLATPDTDNNKALVPVPSSPSSPANNTMGLKVVAADDSLSPKNNNSSSNATSCRPSAISAGTATVTSDTPSVNVYDFNFFEKSSARVSYVSEFREKIADLIYSSRVWLHGVLDHDATHWSMALLICVNTICLAIEHHNQPQTLTQTVEVVSLVVTVVFTIEFLAKLYAYGFFNYIRDGFNAIDTIILVISILELVESVRSGLSVLRTFRLIRFLKLLRFFPTLQRQLAAMLRTLDNVATFLLLLGLFFLIFSMVGMSLFGCRYYSYETQSSCTPTFARPPMLASSASSSSPLVPPLDTLLDDASAINNTNSTAASPSSSSSSSWQSMEILEDKSCRRWKSFESPLSSLLTVLQILTQDDGWSQVMREAMAIVGSWAAIYFVLLVIFGSYVLLSMLLAIIEVGLTRNFGHRKSSMFFYANNSSASSTTQANTVKNARTSRNSLTKIISGFASDMRGKSNKNEEGQAAVAKDANGRNASISSLGKVNETVPGCGHPSNNDGEAVGDEAIVPATMTVAPSSPTAKQRLRAFVHRLLHSNCMTERFSRDGNYSLFLFSPDNVFRGNLLQVVTSMRFDQMVLGVILLNCVVVGFERPAIAAGSFERRFLDAANHAFNLFFVVEAALKIIAEGFVFGPNTYLRNGWNIFDFILVTLSMIEFVIELNEARFATAAIKALHILRLFHTFRPLRAINRAPGLKMVIKTLATTVKPIGTILMITLCIFFVFAILGVQLYRGCFYKCRLASDIPPVAFMANKGLTWRPAKLINATMKQRRQPVNETMMTLLSTVKTRDECQLYDGLEWSNEENNFDSLGSALMTLFVLLSFDGWKDIAQNGLNCVGVDKQPVSNYNPWHLVFFMSFLMINGFCLVDMFAGVVVNNYAKVKEALERETFAKLDVVKDAEDLEQVSVTFVRRRGALRPQLDESRLQYWERYPPWRLRIHNLCTNRYFEISIEVTVGINILAMALEHYQMSPELQVAIRIVNLMVLLAFIFEAFVRLVAFGPKRYFRDRWHMLDLSIIILSIVGTVLESIDTKIFPVNPSFVRSARVCRITRIFRLMKMATGIQGLFQTVISALPQVGNLSLLLLLLFFIYGSLGVEIFGKLESHHKLNGLSRHANFGNIGMSTLALFRIATGDRWHELLKDVLYVISRPYCLDSETSPASAPPPIVSDLNKTLSNASNFSSTDNFNLTSQEAATNNFNNYNSTVLTPMMSSDTGNNSSSSSNTGDDVLGSGYAICALVNLSTQFYFVSFILLCQFVLINIVVTVLMRQLEEADRKEIFERARQKMAKNEESLYHDKESRYRSRLGSDEESDLTSTTHDKSIISMKILRRESSDPELMVVTEESPLMAIKSATHNADNAADHRGRLYSRGRRTVGFKSETPVSWTPKDNNNNNNSWNNSHNHSFVKKITSAPSKLIGSRSHANISCHRDYDGEERQEEAGAGVTTTNNNRLGFQPNSRNFRRRSSSLPSILRSHPPIAFGGYVFSAEEEDGDPNVDLNNNNNTSTNSDERAAGEVFKVTDNHQHDQDGVVAVPIINKGGDDEVVFIGSQQKDNDGSDCDHHHHQKKKADGTNNEDRSRPCLKKVQ